jgi:hypothetical protein
MLLLVATPPIIGSYFWQVAILLAIGYIVVVLLSAVADQLVVSPGVESLRLERSNEQKLSLRAANLL